MSKYTKEELLRHVKTHTERSNDDRAAVTVLESFLRSNGEINHNFSYNDKEPNIDGRFELVPFPELSTFLTPFMSDFFLLDHLPYL